MRKFRKGRGKGGGGENEPVRLNERQDVVRSREGKTDEGDIAVVKAGERDDVTIEL
jgi:hypothetical protein